MKYLVTTTVQPPFLTNWFDAKNHFNVEVGMIVYDLERSMYTTDGTEWKKIKIDFL